MKKSTLIGWLLIGLAVMGSDSDCSADFDDDGFQIEVDDDDDFDFDDLFDKRFLSQHASAWTAQQFAPAA